ncbi:hypothetical protein ACWIGM_07325 [Bosea sp. NPDC055332]
MRSLSDTIARLKAAKGKFPLAGAAAQPSRLSPLGDFGANPGALQGYCYVPQRLPADAPPVVVLHSCTQTAAGYDNIEHRCRPSQTCGEMPRMITRSYGDYEAPSESGSSGSGANGSISGNSFFSRSQSPNLAGFTAHSMEARRLRAHSIQALRSRALA